MFTDPSSYDLYQVGLKVVKNFALSVGADQTLKQVNKLGNSIYSWFAGK